MLKKLLFILIGTAAMMILSLLRRKKYRLSLWKAILTPFVLTIFGVLGTLVLFFIETGQWGGVSFYGSVFLIPVGLLLYSWLIKEKYTHVLDFSVTQICAMLACMKISCLVDGCCFGILLFQHTNGQMIRFPSQIIEMIVSVCIMLIFLYKA
jgi:prolipoprotein diacylglyceryltransferase